MPSQAEVSQASLEAMKSSLASVSYQHHNNIMPQEIQQEKTACYLVRKVLITSGQYDERPVGNYEFNEGISEDRRVYLTRAAEFYSKLYDQPHAELYYKRLCSVYRAIHSLISHPENYQDAKDAIVQAIESYQEAIHLLVDGAVQSDHSFDLFFSPEGPTMTTQDWGLQLNSEGNWKQKLLYMQDYLVQGANRFLQLDFRSYLFSSKLGDSVISFSKYNDIPFVTNPLELKTMLDETLTTTGYRTARGEYARSHCNQDIDVFVDRLNALPHDQHPDNGFISLNTAEPRSSSSSRVETPSGLRSRIGSLFSSRRSSRRTSPTRPDPEPTRPSRIPLETNSHFNRRIGRWEAEHAAWRERQRRRGNNVPSPIPSDDGDEEPDQPQPEPQPATTPPQQPEQPAQPPQPQGQGTTPPTAPITQIVLPPADEYHEPNSQEGMLSNVFLSLKRRSRAILDEQRTDPDKYAGNSHLRRFRNPNAKPTQLSIREVQTDDILVNACNSRDSVQFVLTFGGQDWHPVFDRIIDPRRSRMF